MKHIFKLMLVVALVSLWTVSVGSKAEAQSSDCQLSVNQEVFTGTVRIHESPDLKSTDAMGGLGVDPVEILASSDGWYLVRRGQTTGFVRFDTQYPYIFILNGEGCSSLPSRGTYELNRQIDVMPPIPETCDFQDVLIIPSHSFVPVYLKSDSGDYLWVGTFEDYPFGYVPGRDGWYAEWLSIPLSIDESEGTSPLVPVITGTGDGGLRSGGIEYLVHYIYVLDEKLVSVQATTDGGSLVQSLGEFLSTDIDTFGTWGIDADGTAYFNHRDAYWIKAVNTSVEADLCS